MDIFDAMVAAKKIANSHKGSHSLVIVDDWEDVMLLREHYTNIFECTYRNLGLVTVSKAPKDLEETISNFGGIKLTNLFIAGEIDEKSLSYLEWRIKSEGEII